MFLAKLAVTREGYIGRNYSRCDPSKPLRATVEIVGVNGTTELDLGPEASARIMAVISEELIASARATAEAMTSEIIAMPMLAA